MSKIACENEMHNTTASVAVVFYIFDKVKLSMLFRSVLWLALHGVIVQQEPFDCAPIRFYI